MTDLPAAIAAAREALAAYRRNSTRHYIDEALEDVLAALDAARGEAVPIAWIHLGDVETQRQNPDNVAYVLAKPCSGYVPLYAAPPAAPAAVHSTQDCYEHFLAYSGATDHPWLKYAYFHGADVGLDRPVQAPPAEQGECKAKPCAVPAGYVPLVAAEALALEAMRVGNLGGHERTVEGHWSAEVGCRFEEFMFEEGFAMLAAAPAAPAAATQNPKEK